MSRRNRLWRVLLVFALCCSVANAGNNIGRSSAVGGVSINVEGVLDNATDLSLQVLNEGMGQAFRAAPGELNKPVELRKISLKAVNAALRDSDKNQVAQLPDEIKYLAGIQRIQYVLLYPEQNDIVLAGPGEGWELDGKGNVVGVTTGRPVLSLEDLLVAFRTVEEARKGGISCSIDPTAEGRQRFEQYMSTQRQYNPAVLDGIEKAMGNQQITVSGVPDTSHFARVLVAADYKMKRIGMKLDKSPVRGLASFIDMIPGKLDNMMPRWWMACNYEPLGRSEDGLAWELRGTGVKVMTEDEFVDNAAGTVKGTGKVNPVAQKWSDQFTAKYEDLAVKEPVFGELRNIMDMCVVAALITKENLPAKAKCELPELSSAKMGIESFPAPKKVATQSSALKRGNNWIITASGGVAINSWEIADKTEVKASVGETRAKAKSATTNNLWWN
ncbi:hypothetical protein ETAA8_47810 [Anatilimnocola aggregata]|uniref:DUF1598 domain-containing protein n=1 Tax=Anatilimnocola aggregata TaxID=2528021 RepID=A0A517YHG5_9BACT|nr:DUF1598 domain-containing protein [Anatilimnocola aggregata]QDU29666.1 hypothetical protein ETAA8_47810 [Anatilimnocola aggregata]